MSNRVFIVNRDDRYDVSAAEEYGELVYIFDDLAPRFTPQLLADKIGEFLDKENFDPAKDWFCLTGNMLYYSVAVAVIARRFPSLPLLVFHSRTSKYISHVVEIANGKSVARAS